MFLGTAGVAHAKTLETMTVYKTPWCGCCEVWTRAMQKAGFKVNVKDIDDLTLIKRTAGIPEQLEGCHTAKLGRYYVEGHVPLQAITKLVAERPDVRGIAVAGMPMGSLGMGYDPKARYDVMAFGLRTNENPVVFHEAGK